LYRAKATVNSWSTLSRLIHRQAVQQCAKLVGRDHDVTLGAQTELARRLIFLREPEEAEEWLLDAIDVYKRDRDRYVREWCICLETLSFVYSLTERRHLVRQLYLEGVQTARMSAERFRILVRQPPRPVL